MPPHLLRYDTFWIRFTALLYCNFVGIMATELSTAAKKEWAQLLFLKDELTQKDIAQKVGVSERTMSKWAKDNNWDALRKSMLTTKSEQLRNLYGLLEKITRKLKEDDSIGDAKIADMYVKYTAAINNLETETSTSQVIEVARMFVNWLQPLDPQYALSVLNHFDSFIKEKLKRF